MKRRLSECMNRWINRWIGGWIILFLSIFFLSAVLKALHLFPQNWFISCTRQWLRKFCVVPHTTGLNSPVTLLAALLLIFPSNCRSCNSLEFVEISKASERVKVKWSLLGRTCSLLPNKFSNLFKIDNFQLFALNNCIQLRACGVWPAVLRRDTETKLGGRQWTWHEYIKCFELHVYTRVSLMSLYTSNWANRGLV